MTKVDVVLTGGNLSKPLTYRRTIFVRPDRESMLDQAWKIVRDRWKYYRQFPTVFVVSVVGNETVQGSVFGTVPEDWKE